jgi:ribosomal protein L11 methyltransferase
MDDVEACVDAEARFASLCRKEGLEVEVWHEMLRDDWRTGWIEHLEPVQLGERLTLVPRAPGEKREPNTLYLQPALAFGFGEHPTTCLAAEWLMETAPASRVLDVGTGTGVLALIAAWAGAAHVSGVDIDATSVRAAEVNATLNCLPSVCEFSLAQLEELPRDFDVVIANIDALTLAALAEQMCARLSPGGKMALTGVLLEQAAAVTQAFAQRGLPLHVHAEADGWALLST